jgi:hypothetical protein
MRMRMGMGMGMRMRMPATRKKRQDADGNDGDESEAQSQTNIDDAVDVDKTAQNPATSSTTPNVDGEKPKRHRKKPVVGYKVSAAPYARRIAKQGKPAIKMPDGILHCGCVEDEALLDFWWFKSGKITSLFNGLSEGWLDEVALPHPRAFTAALFHETSTLRIAIVSRHDESQVLDLGVMPGQQPQCLHSRHRVLATCRRPPAHLQDSSHV